jgi:hypothetical protein
MYGTIILVGRDVDIQTKPKFLVEALGPFDVRDSLTRDNRAVVCPHQKARSSRTCQLRGARPRLDVHFLSLAEVFVEQLLDRWIIWIPLTKGWKLQH